MKDIHMVPACLPNDSIELDASRDSWKAGKPSLVPWEWFILAPPSKLGINLLTTVELL